MVFGLEERLKNHQPGKRPRHVEYTIHNAFCSQTPDAFDPLRRHGPVFVLGAAPGSLTSRWNGPDSRRILQGLRGNRGFAAYTFGFVQPRSRAALTTDRRFTGLTRTPTSIASTSAFNRCQAKCVPIGIRVQITASTVLKLSDTRKMIKAMAIVRPEGSFIHKLNSMRAANATSAGR